MTLPDGTTIEMPMPSPEDTDAQDKHCYRVRRVDNVIEFSTLIELISHLRGCE